MKRSLVTFHPTFPAGLSLWLSICIVTGPIYSQVRGGGSAAVDSIIDKVREGKFSMADLYELVGARAVQAKPVLQAQFTIVNDPVLKGALASALVRLGDQQPIYWDFLAGKAKAAIDSDAPWVSDFDSAGNTIPRRLSARFLEWAKANQVNPNAAAEVQVYRLPGDVIFLAITGDSRGLTILRKGLVSQNYMIQANSARGLALLRDKDSIPLIIDACERAPSEMASVIALALVFFDDVNAQNSAARFILNKELLQELRKLRHEKGPFETI